MAKAKDDRTALVTGAGRRLGRTIALDLAANGWRVGVHYRASAAEAAGLVAEIERNGGKAAASPPISTDLMRLPPLIAACADGSRPADLPHQQRRALRARTRLPRSTARPGRRISTSICGRRSSSPKPLPRPCPMAQEGNVINLLDQKVLRLDPDYFSYTIAKSALWSATQTMAQALAPRIRVNAIAPGPVLKQRGAEPERFRAGVRRDPAAKGRERGRRHGRRQIPARDAVDHGPDHRARRRPASRLRSRKTRLRPCRPGS